MSIIDLLIHLIGIWKLLGRDFFSFKSFELRKTMCTVMIDEVDYDSNSPGVPIFVHSSNWVNSQQEVRSPSTFETPKLGFPRMKDDSSLMNKKGCDHKGVR